MRLVERIASAKMLCSFFMMNSSAARMLRGQVALFELRLDVRQFVLDPVQAWPQAQGEPNRTVRKQFAAIYLEAPFELCSAARES
jgi:hypothetical protein